MITINVDKAKEISHNIRRDVRAKEFAPLDEIIMKRIPETDFDAIEAQRQQIRDKYAELQTNIDQATSAEELLAIVNEIKGTDQ
jgi:hypothetical protein